MFVYIENEEKKGKKPSYQVGHYNPKGEFVPEPMYLDVDAETAAKRVRYLNGGE